VVCLCVCVQPTGSWSWEAPDAGPVPQSVSQSVWKELPPKKGEAGATAADAAGLATNGGKRKKHRGAKKPHKH
jgi:hypothetical protein